MKRGEGHHSAKLTEAIVRSFRRLYWVKGMDSMCITRLYEGKVSLNNSSVWDAINYVTWRHVRDNWTAEQMHPTRRK